VSRNSVYGSKYKTAFSCTLEGGESTLISGDHNKCMEYAQKVPNININETLIITILNTNVYAGTAYFGFATSSGNITELGIGYCPIINGLQSELFRQVLVHEAVGHAYAKLLDEYSYQSQGTIPEFKKREIKDYQTKYGWAMNIDTTSDPQNIVWAKFITDKRYSWENIGVYQGAGTYIKGAYRSTQNSLMNDNTISFNTPSREAIYKRTLKLAYGKEFVYDYETFVAFDLSYQQSLKQKQNNTRSSNEKPAMPTPPIILNQRMPTLR
ncbi:MAG: M64 family metallopeptidase, partial [Phocaeicola sp.]